MNAFTKSLLEMGGIAHPNTTLIYLLSVVFSIGVPIFFRHRTGNIFAWFWGYLLLHTGFTGMNPWYVSALVSNGVFLKIVQDSQFLWWLWLTLPPALLWVPRDTVAALVVLISCVFAFDTGYTLLFHKGLFDVRSLDCALAATTVPIWFYLHHSPTRRVRWFAYLCVSLIVLACIFARSKTGLGCMFIQVLAYLYTGTESQKVWARAFISSAVAVIIIHPSILYTSGRVELWVEKLSWVFKHRSDVSGLGLGAFKWISTFQPFKELRYSTLHNDFLQVFYELGYAGVGLLVAAIYKKVRFLHSLGQPSFALACGFVFTMLWYSPSYYALTFTLAMVLLLRGEELDEELYSLSADL